MANSSSTVSTGDVITAAQYNDLRTDAIGPYGDERNYPDNTKATFGTLAASLADGEIFSDGVSWIFDARGGFNIDFKVSGVTRLQVTSSGFNLVGNQLFDDNEKIIMGTGVDAEIFFDATDLIINPDAVGSGVLKVGSTLEIEAGANLRFGAITALVDSPAGTMTLSNIDALDSATEATIEAAIDTLPNLTTATSLTITESQLSDLGTAIALVADNLSVFAATSSSQLAGVISDETGSGLLVFGTSPALGSPVLTTPQINDTSSDHQYIIAVNELAADRTVTLPLLAGNDTFVFEAFIQTLTNKTIATASNTITVVEADISDLGATIALVADNLSVFAATTSAQLAGVISDETGTGLLVFGTSPTFVTPALGTPASGVATNLTGTAASLTAGNVTTNANLTGHVTSVGNAAVLGSFTAAQLNTAVSDDTVALISDTLAVFAATTSAQLAGVISNETGTGLLVFGTSPTLTTPNIGAATATSLSVTDGNITNVGDIALDSISADGTSIAISNDIFTANDTGIVIGHTAQVTINTQILETQILGTGVLDAATLWGRWSADTGGIIHRYIKSRDPALADGTFATVVAGDDILDMQFFVDDGVDLDTLVAEFVVEAGTVAGAGDIGAEYIWRQRNGAGSGLVETLRLTQVGSLQMRTESYLWIGPDSLATGFVDANLTVGLVINQEANDDHAIELKSSDIAHGFTGSAETDSYYFIRKTSATIGGANIQAFAEDGALGTVLLHESIGGTATTTKSTAGRSLIEFAAFEHNGSGTVADITADGNVFGIRARVGGSTVTRMLVDEDGEIHAVVTPVNDFPDKYEDVYLIRELAHLTSPDSIIRSRFDDFAKYNEQHLIDAGVLGDTIENGGLWNFNQYFRLLSGAAWQQEVKHLSLVEDVRRLEGQLKALTEAK